MSAAFTPFELEVKEFISCNAGTGKGWKNRRILIDVIGFSMHTKGVVCG